MEIGMTHTNPDGSRVTIYVGSGAIIADDATIGARVVIGSGATIGARVVIGERAVINADARIGSGATIDEQAFIDSGATIGDGATIGERADIGAYVTTNTIEGTAFRRACGGWLAVSAEKCPVHIGVSGATEREARDGLRSALLRWQEILNDQGQ